METTAASSHHHHPKRTFRITGELAGRRIRPLLAKLPVNWEEADSDASALDFVWETHVPRHWKATHDKATVLNRLSNSVILENKAHLAVLQSRMKDVPTLETYILRGKEVPGWAERRWGPITVSVSGGEEDGSGPTLPSSSCSSSSSTPSPCPSSSSSSSSSSSLDWWMLKATGANGGVDVFVFHRDTRPRVLPRILPDELYVVQRYVAHPLLYHGRKFHFRCYALLRADLRAYLYRKAYILAASNPFSLHDSDDLTHLTNLSVNKVVDTYPGEIPCLLPQEYPQAFQAMKDVWASLIAAASPFLAEQVSPHHFDFFGLDFIMDDHGHAWLLEVNRLPGITSSKQNKAEEDLFFDDLIDGILHLCVLPVLTHSSSNGSSSKDHEASAGEWECVSTSTSHQDHDGRPVVVNTSSTTAWRNVLKFSLYAKKLCSGVLGGHLPLPLPPCSSSSAD